MYNSYKEYNPFDCIEDLVKYSVEKQDIEYWKSLPDRYIEVVMDNGKVLKMRIVAEEDCMKRFGYAAYWFAFDNHEEADYEDEFDFANHVDKWKFIECEP